MQLDAMKERFWDTPGVEVVEGRGGLPCLQLRCDAGAADVYTLGAHVTHFQPAGAEPVLWLSEASWFEPGKPIRGGIPICWPWFGPHATEADWPGHGFARTQEWDVTSAGLDGDGCATATLELRANDISRQYGVDAFELQARIVVGRQLTVELTTRNTGEQPLQLSEALHSYFRVSDVREISISGLAGTEFFDKADKVGEVQRKRQGDEPIRFTAETDRVYVDTTATCVLDDPGLRRRITVAKAGSQSTVVWNPHIAKAARMPDYGDEEWPGMVCIETANAADNALSVPPGETHTLATTMAVQP